MRVDNGHHHTCRSWRKGEAQPYLDSMTSEQLQFDLTTGHLIIALHAMQLADKMSSRGI